MSDEDGKKFVWVVKFDDYAFEIHTIEGVYQSEQDALKHVKNDHGQHNLTIEKQEVK